MERVGRRQGGCALKKGHLNEVQSSHGRAWGGVVRGWYGLVIACPGRVKAWLVLGIAWRGPGPIWGPWSGHAITRPGHALTRPGHAITRPGHAITKPGHAITWEFWASLRGPFLRAYNP